MQFLEDTTPLRSIRLDDAQGNEIPNYQEARAAQHAIDRYNRDRQSSWKAVRPPGSPYNCAGHVLANRRTSVDDARPWREILQADGFKLSDSGIPGDVSAQLPVLGAVVLYCFSNKDPFHIGVVAEIATEPFRTVRVLSKFGPVGGEELHALADVPGLEWWEIWSPV